MTTKVTPIKFVHEHPNGSTRECTREEVTETIKKQEYRASLIKRIDYLTNELNTLTSQCEHVVAFDTPDVTGLPGTIVRRCMLCGYSWVILVDENDNNS